jgi:hypothetical protein
MNSRKKYNDFPYNTYVFCGQGNFGRNIRSKKRFRNAQLRSSHSATHVITSISSEKNTLPTNIGYSKNLEMCLLLELYTVHRVYNNVCSDNPMKQLQLTTLPM